ncbi:MAG TPA: DUF1592 domain-containing protein [Myxococcaceae bacterium]|nr:DUF1592 domain-containing protein [Myxococcaceae bacterium]
MVAALTLLAGSDGKIVGAGGAPGGGTPSAAALKMGPTGAHRLSRDEYGNTLRDLVGDTSGEGFALLPEDAHDPFDNNYLTQLASQSLIDAAEQVATDVAQRLIADPQRLQSVLPCTPTGAGDAACLKRFIATFGRRALRRPLTDAEVAEYASLQSFAVEKNDFKIAVGLVVQAMLQDPEFLYRVERGTPAAGPAGTFRLSAFEVATRLSYFLWGSTPPDWLLDAAGGGQLESKEQIRAAAVRLLADPRARDRVDRFHALWLGFHQLPHPVDLTNAFRTETGALIQKVVFQDQADYFQLFTSSQTYANATLVTNYGLPVTPPANGYAWVSYAGTGRKGILSQGAVLSAGAKFGDTSPTQRGIFVRSRLLCETIQPPPPNVDVDQKPTSPTSNCKVDRYSAHSANGNCNTCHKRLDPVGFGLEAYDTSGAFRTHDVGEPTCAISGNGALDGVGSFNGPGGLADLLVQSPGFEGCITTQLFRFAMGRNETVDDADLISQLTRSFHDGQRRFDQLLLGVVSDDRFAYRREE